MGHDVDIRPARGSYVRPRAGVGLRARRNHRLGRQQRNRVDERDLEPVTGCDKVSPGCAHCYAETFAERWRDISEHPYQQGFNPRLWPNRLDQPLRWKRPRTIFVHSMSDLFHKRIPESFIRQVFEVMEQASQHTF